MAFIYMIIVVLLLVLIAWSWHNLGDIHKKTKVICIIIGIVVIFVLTFFIYGISKKSVEYQSLEVMKIIQNVMVSIFTIVNGYILLPYVFKILDKLNNNEIEQNVFKKYIIIMIIIFGVISIIECKYLSNTQQGILNIMENLKR